MPIRILGLAALLLAAGCHAPEPAAPAPDPAEAAPTDAAMSPPADPSMDASVAAARADLAGRLGVAEAAVEVVEHRRVTWRNGAMGCPEPGMAYTQALVPGYWIRLAVDGATYDYHGARDRTPFLCPADRAERPLPPDDEPLA